MKISKNKILIILVIVVAFVVLYNYFSTNLKSEAADSSLNSVKTTEASSDENGGTVSVSQRIAKDTAFISKLKSLTSIKIDTSLFDNKLFSKLNDNNVTIVHGEIGRTNPFAPIEGSTTIFKVSTDKAIIGATDVVLNGSANSQNITNAYFEYGTTPTKLDKKTSFVNVSMIGNFSYNVTGLLPKTQYFYRAVANVNSVPSYGEVIIFTTN
jgi:hypothetical protein